MHENINSRLKSCSRTCLRFFPEEEARPYVSVHALKIVNIGPYVVFCPARRGFFGIEDGEIFFQRNNHGPSWVVRLFLSSYNFIHVRYALMDAQVCQPAVPKNPAYF